MRVLHSVDSRLSEALYKLEMIETSLASSDPRRILEKGFVLALDKDGIRISSAASTSAGESLRILFPDGTVRTTVSGVELNKE